jgi:TM2 domain-containing membrane protein YozV
MANKSKKSSVKVVVIRKEKGWITALILSIFLGWLGIDRFYLGKFGTGIIKLFTLGFFGIWWIIDIILIAVKFKFAGIEWI